jgi:hypothetical protein
MKNAVFWDVEPCRSREMNRHFGGTYRLHFQSRKIREREFSTLKMKAILSSETSVHFTRSTRRHIPKDDILHNHRCENLKSYIESTHFHIRKASTFSNSSAKFANSQ